MDAGLLIAHAFLGTALIAHGLQKLLVFGRTGTAAYLESLGFRAPGAMAIAVIGSELLGGGLIGAGLLLPLGAAIAAGTMIVAARTDHRGKGWFITGSGAEYVATNAVFALALAATGGGRYAADGALGLDLAGLQWTAAAAGTALAAATVVLTTARNPSPSRSRTHEATIPTTPRTACSDLLPRTRQRDSERERHLDSFRRSPALVPGRTARARNGHSRRRS